MYTEHHVEALAQHWPCRCPTESSSAEASISASISLSIRANKSFFKGVSSDALCGDSVTVAWRTSSCVYPLLHLRHVAVAEFDLKGRHFTMGTAMNFMPATPPNRGSRMIQTRAKCIFVLSVRGQEAPVDSTPKIV